MVMKHLLRQWCETYDIHFDQQMVKQTLASMSQWKDNMVKDWMKEQQQHERSMDEHASLPLSQGQHPIQNALRVEPQATTTRQGPLATCRYPLARGPILDFVVKIDQKHATP